MFWTQGKGLLATKYIRDYRKNSRTTWLICSAKKRPFSLELQVLVSPILVIPSPVSMSLGSQIRHRRLWVAMESDHWQVDGVDWGWLFVQWALSSTDLSSSETRILLYTSLCVSLCLTPLDPVCQLLLSWLSISLSTHVLSAGPSPTLHWPLLWRQRTTQLATTKSSSLVLMLLQTLRVFGTLYSLLQPWSLILAFWFLEISIKLNSLHPRTYSGCESTSSPN